MDFAGASGIPKEYELRNRSGPRSPWVQTPMGRFKFSSWTLHVASIIIFSGSG
jgi:hypothetical protein